MLPYEEKMRRCNRKFAKYEGITIIRRALIPDEQLDGNSRL